MRPRLRAGIVVVLTALGGSVPPLWAANDDLRLPAPTFPVASVLHDADQSAEALAVLDRQLERLTGDDLPAEAQILSATLLTAVGRHQESEALWNEVAERERSLKTFALRAVVMSLADRGEPAQAERRLTELTRATSTRQHWDLILRVAEAQLGAGAFSEAAALYGRVLRSQRRGTFADAARLGLAAAQEFTGDLDGAVRTFRQAQLEHRAPDVFRDARAGEQRVSGLRDRTPQGFTEDQYLTLARRLRIASQYEESRELLEAWRRRYPETPRVDLIEAEIIDTLYSMRANDEAAARCLQFDEHFPGKPTARASAADPIPPRCANEPSSGGQIARRRPLARSGRRRDGRRAPKHGRTFGCVPGEHGRSRSRSGGLSRARSHRPYGQRSTRHALARRRRGTPRRPG